MTPGHSSLGLNDRGVTQFDIGINSFDNEVHLYSGIIQTDDSILTEPVRLHSGTKLIEVFMETTSNN